LSYYHRDEQLSTAFIADRDGEIQNSYLYDAFGAELEADEQLQNRIRYTGQQYDDLTGRITCGQGTIILCLGDLCRKTLIKVMV